jgi:hypothetical protein
LIFRNILCRPKDAIISVIVKRTVNKNIAGIGKIINASLDSMGKKASFLLALKGEKETISFDVVRYEIVKENGVCFIVAEEIAASREWIGTASLKFLVGKKMKIPTMLSMFLE